MVRREHLSGNRCVPPRHAIHELDLRTGAIVPDDFGNVDPELPGEHRLLEPRGDRGATGEHGFRTAGELDRGRKVPVALSLTRDRARVCAQQPELAPT